MSLEQGSAEMDWIETNCVVTAETKFPVRASADGENLVILKTKSGLRGIQSTCPHQGASWLKGELMSNGSMIRCPLHSFIFRLADGKGVNCPGHRVAVYETDLRDGCLWVRNATAK